MAKKILAPLDLSAIPTGTAPLVMASTTVVTNLNADLLDGQHGSYYADITARLGYTPVNRAGDTMTGGLAAPTFTSRQGDVGTQQIMHTWTHTDNVPRLYQVLEGSGAYSIYMLTAAGAGAPNSYQKFEITLDSWRLVSDAQGFKGPDLWSIRPGNAGHGIVWLGNTGTRYLYYDGNYVMPGAELYINGGVAWHTNNDGAGSGLDADLLDGQHGSYYARAAVAGVNWSLTSADNRTFAIAPTDLTAPGIYQDFKTTANSGAPGNFFAHVETISLWSDDSGGGVHQLIYSDNGNLYRRYGTRAGGWGTTRTVWDSGTFDPATKLNTAGGTMTGELTASFNVPALSAGAYADGHIELITSDGSHPRIGFHRGGINAVALYYAGNDGSGPYMGIRDNGNGDYRLATLNAAQWWSAQQTFEAAIKAPSLSIGASSPINSFPLDVTTPGGRLLVRDSGGITSIDSVNTVNNAFAALNFTATSFTFAGGSLNIGGGNITGRDFTALRPEAPTTGVIFFGNSGGRYLFFDGSKYILNDAPVQINSGPLLTQESGKLRIEGGARAYDRWQTLTANSAGWHEQPRVFVQSTDPGAAAADGDLWIW